MHCPKVVREVTVFVSSNMCLGSSGAVFPKAKPRDNGKERSTLSHKCRYSHIVFAIVGKK